MTAAGSSFEAVFLDNLSAIDRIVGSLCRRYGVTGRDAEDLSSWIRMRLIEDEYAVFRKFRGESAITTYLTVVIAMLVREYRVKQWGRWRPSAAALRHGPLAVRLESLIHRRGCTLDEAAQILRVSGGTSLSDRELAALAASLPTRAPLRPIEVPTDTLRETAATASAEDAVVATELVEERTAAERALSDALDRLGTEERLVLRMRFWEGMSIADISRALAVPQKPLYRRLERALVGLRARLEEGGISSAEVRALLTEVSDR